MTILTKASFAALLLAAMPLAAEAKADVGTLTCTLTGVQNDIIYTDEKFACTFAPTKGPDQTYVGQFSKIGVNLSVTKDLTLVWGVLAPSDHPEEPKSLAGTYVGADAQVALGAGGGANVLVGGGKDSFTLQPISVTGLVGAGASLTVDEFQLK